MRSIFAPLKLDATARGLELETSLDLRIDQVAKNIAAGGFEGVAEEGEGIVLGDELRLRQVVNNLTSYVSAARARADEMTATRASSPRQAARSRSSRRSSIPLPSPPSPPTLRRHFLAR